jgi:hypothetical protein
LPHAYNYSVKPIKKQGIMELLIAVLIAFGVVSGNNAGNLDATTAQKLIKENNITKADLEKQASIIGLEDSDM